MGSHDKFHWCCWNGAKKIENHWLLWGRPRSRFPMQGMVGPDWRIGAWTFCCIPSATAGWACLIILGGPNDGGHTARVMIVIVGAVLAFVSMALYLCTACTDPGIVFKHRARRVTSAGARSSASVSGDRNFTLPGSATVGGAAVAHGVHNPPPTGAGTPVPFGEAEDGMPGMSSAKLKLPGVDGGSDPAVNVGFRVGMGGGMREGARVDGVGDIEGQRAVPRVELMGGERDYAVNGSSDNVVDMRNAPPIASPLWGRAPTSIAFAPAAVSVVQFGHSAARVGARIEPQTVCGRCQIYRPARAVHCNACNVCVDRLDHHCPFMGQCVGRKTLPSFYMFVVAIWILVCYVGLGIGYLVVALLVDGL